MVFMSVSGVRDEVMLIVSRNPFCIVLLWFVSTNRKDNERITVYFSEGPLPGFRLNFLMNHWNLFNNNN